MPKRPKSSSTAKFSNGRRRRFWWQRQEEITGPLPVVVYPASPAALSAPSAPSNELRALPAPAASGAQSTGLQNGVGVISTGKKRARPRNVGEVQKMYVTARTIVGNLLCVRPQGAAATSTPGPNDSYCAILDVSPINFLLRSEEEQEDIIDSFGQWLNSLRFPVQILVQVRRLDLGPYVSRLQAAVSERVESLEEARTQRDVQARWIKVATDHVDFVVGLARKKLLLERHFYVILTFEGETSGNIAGGSLASQWAGSFSRRFRGDAVASATISGKGLRGRQSKQNRSLSNNLRAWQRQTMAQQQLDLRVAEMGRAFERLGLEIRQVEGSELATVYYRALTPERATQHPLPKDVVDGLDLPVESSALAGSHSGRSSHSSDGTGGSQDHRIARSEFNAPVPASRPLAAPQRDFASLADLLAPASVELAPDNLCLEGEYSRILAITSYPRQVSPGWLARVIDEDYPLDLSMHIHPRDSRAALRSIRNKLAQFEASAGLDHRMGRLPDPQRRIAMEDISALQTRIERGTTHVFDFGLYVRLYASRTGGLAQLEHRTEAVHGAFDHLGLVARPSQWEQDQAFASVLPQGRDALHRTRLFDTETIGTAWPFSTSSVSMSEGILFGLVPQNGSFVILDPFSRSFENANQIVFGVSGGGKSYATKLRVIRSLIAGISSVIVDPENEYARLTIELGGQNIRLAPGSNQHINPFDLPAPGDVVGMMGGGYGVEDEDPLADKIQSLHALFDLLLAERGNGHSGTLSRTEKALLDQVILAAYERAGITSDRQTHSRPAPLLRDVYELLTTVPDFKVEDTTGLASRLHRYVVGTLSRLFAAPTDVQLDNPLVVFNIADLDEELRPLGLFLVSDCIWTHVRKEQLAPRPRLLLVDEAWSLLQFPEGGRFLASLVRRARKRYLGVVTISQDINDFLGSEWGQTILKNSSTKLLMKQDTSSIDLITETFKLSTGERRQLLASEKGEGLLFALGARIAIRVEASHDEHLLATTDPHEMEQLQQQLYRQTARPSIDSAPSSVPPAGGVPHVITREITREITTAYTEELVPGNWPTLEHQVTPGTASPVMPSAKPSAMPSAMPSAVSPEISPFVPSAPMTTPTSPALLPYEAESGAEDVSDLDGLGESDYSQRSWEVSDPRAYASRQVRSIPETPAVSSGIPEPDNGEDPLLYLPTRISQRHPENLGVPPNERSRMFVVRTNDEETGS